MSLRELYPSTPVRVGADRGTHSNHASALRADRQTPSGARTVDRGSLFGTRTPHALFPTPQRPQPGTATTSALAHPVGALFNASSAEELAGGGGLQPHVFPSPSPVSGAQVHPRPGPGRGGVKASTPDEERRRNQRQKQVSFGLATEGYRNMIRLVEHDPVLRSGGILPLSPPDIVRGSKRVWDIQLRRWRRALHMFDYVFIDGQDDEARREHVTELQRRQWVSAAFAGGSSSEPSEADEDGGEGVRKPAEPPTERAAPATGEEKSGSEDAETWALSARVRRSMEELLAVRTSPCVPAQIPVEDDLRCILRGDSCYEPVRNVVPQTASSLTKGTDICPLEAGIKIHIAPSTAVLRRQRELLAKQQHALHSQKLLQHQQQQQQVEANMLGAQETSTWPLQAATTPGRATLAAKDLAAAALLGSGLSPSPSPTRPSGSLGALCSPHQHGAAAGRQSGTDPRTSAGLSLSPSQSGHAAPPPLPSAGPSVAVQRLDFMSPTPVRDPSTGRPSDLAALLGLSVDPSLAYAAGWAPALPVGRPCSEAEAAATAAAMTSLLCNPLQPLGLAPGGAARPLPAPGVPFFSSSLYGAVPGNPVAGVPPMGYAFAPTPYAPGPPTAVASSSNGQMPCCPPPQSAAGVLWGTVESQSTGVTMPSPPRTAWTTANAQVARTGQASVPRTAEAVPRFVARLPNRPAEQRLGDKLCGPSRLPTESTAALKADAALERALADACGTAGQPTGEHGQHSLSSSSLLSSHLAELDEEGGEGSSTQCRLFASDDM